MRTLVILLLGFTSFLHAADPAPFADLDSGPAIPPLMKESVFRKFLQQATPSGRHILRAAYYFDISVKRYRLQPGLPGVGISRIEKVLGEKKENPGFFSSLWQWFVRVNSGIQQKVAGLLGRVRREPPLRDIRHLRLGGTDLLAFTSPATGGVRFAALKGGRLAASWTADIENARSLALVKGKNGRGIGAALAASGLWFFFYGKQGLASGRPFSIPLVLGTNLQLAAVSRDRVLAAWERDGSVHGGVVDLRMKTMRRFQPVSGWVLTDRNGSDCLFLQKKDDPARFKPLQWDREHGILPLNSVKGTVGPVPPSIPETKLSWAQGGRVRVFPTGRGLLAVVMTERGLSAREYAPGNSGKMEAGPLLTLYGNQVPVVVLLVLVISLVYGFVHASGPGHGKALVAAYFVDNTHSGWWPPAKMALIVSVVHTGSALLIATLFQVILTVTPDQMAIRKWFTIGSGVLVMLLGLYMLVERIREGRGTPDSPEKPEGKRTMLALGVAAGIVPCPLSMGVMVIAVVNGVYLLGVLSVLGMSAGMFVLLFLIGALTSRSREKLERLLSGKGRASRILAMSAGIVSALVIMILGFALMTPVL